MASSNIVTSLHAEDGEEVQVKLFLVPRDNISRGIPLDGKIGKLIAKMQPLPAKSQQSKDMKMEGYLTLLDENRIKIPSHKWTASGGTGFDEHNRYRGIKPDVRLSDNRTVVPADIPADILLPTVNALEFEFDDVQLINLTPGMKVTVVVDIWVTGVGADGTKTCSVASEVPMFVREN